MSYNDFKSAYSVANSADAENGKRKALQDLAAGRSHFRERSFAKFNDERNAFARAYNKHYGEGHDMTVHGEGKAHGVK